MKYRAFCILALLMVLLTGCNIMSERYVSVTPHQSQGNNNRDGMISAANYGQLRTALENMVLSAQNTAVINVSEYDASALESGMSMAERYIETIYPIGAYAVSDFHYEIGSGGGNPAVAVEIVYSRSHMEIQKIRSAADMAEMADALYEALGNHDAALVLKVENFRDIDFPQLVQDYVENNPGNVMETPQLSVGAYGIGNSRVVEFTFLYQNNRESLRQMKTQVSPVFASADLYVRGDAKDYRKFSQLYAFLMERYDYTIETSITPAYSLLCHGVGDSRAFATVYGAMCRRVGLECLTVTGTRSGEPRTWNVICDNGTYYHVDLLRCNTEGGFRGYSDREMAGYVWDYSSVPACGGVQEEATEPEENIEEITEETTEETTEEAFAEN